MFSLLQQTSPLQIASWIAAALGACVALGTIGFSVYQHYQNTKVNRARFWLDLRKMFGDHHDVHVKLKPDSEWGAIRTDNEVCEEYRKYLLEPTIKGPSTPKEWAQVEAYMGLFELCEIMIEQGLLDERTFKRQYRYRLTNLMWNAKIVHRKIIGRPEGWRDFINLLERFEIAPQVRAPEEQWEKLSSSESTESE